MSKFGMEVDTCKYCGKIIEKGKMICEQCRESMENDTKREGRNLYNRKKGKHNSKRRRDRFDDED